MDRVWTKGEHNVDVYGDGNDDEEDEEEEAVNLWGNLSIVQGGKEEHHTAALGIRL